MAPPGDHKRLAAIGSIKKEERQSTLLQFFSGTAIAEAAAAAAVPAAASVKNKNNTFMPLKKKHDEELQDENDDDDDDDEEEMEISLSSLAMLPSSSSSSLHPFKRQRRSEPLVNDQLSLAFTQPECSTKLITNNTIQEAGKINVAPVATKSCSDPGNDTTTTTSTFKFRQAPVASIRRIVSHSAMDYIPPASAVAKPSLQHCLWDRSTTGSRPWPATCLRPLAGRQRRTEKETTSSTLTTKTDTDTVTTTEAAESTFKESETCNTNETSSSSYSWQCPRWVELHIPAGRGNNNNNNNSKIEHLAWDPLGVLLAVALANRQILIYDWDTIRAADRRGKSEWQRAKQAKREHNHRRCRRRKMTSQQDGEEAPVVPPPSDSSTTSSSVIFSIPPMMQFTVAQSVSCLQWNPYNPDELAVGFKVQGHVHVYQLDAIVTWIEQRQRHAQRSHSWNNNNDDDAAYSGRYPTPDTFTLLQPPSVTGTNSNNNNNNNSTSKKGSVTAIVFAQPQAQINAAPAAASPRVIVSVGHAVYCWKLFKGDSDECTANDTTTTRRRHALFQWRYLPPFPCTSITTVLPSQQRTLPISSPTTVASLSSWIVLATQWGHFCLLDYTRTTTERAAFSLQEKPVVIHEWAVVSLSWPSSSSSGDIAGSVQSKVGNVVRLQVVVEMSQVLPEDARENDAMDETAQNMKKHQCLGQLQMTWVTTRGWVLQSQLHLNSDGSDGMRWGALPTTLTNSNRDTKNTSRVNSRKTLVSLLSSRTNLSSTTASAKATTRLSEGLFSMIGRQRSTNPAPPSTNGKSHAAKPSSATMNSDQTKELLSQQLLSVSAVSSSAKVVYSPPNVRLYNAQGLFVGQDVSAYSVPADPVHAHIVGSNSNWILWPEIPTMSKYLGHHDKFVLDDQPKIVREAERAIRFFDSIKSRRNASTESELSTWRISVKTLPNVMALHPGFEWLVLGVEHRLVVLVNRV